MIQLNAAKKGKGGANRGLIHESFQGIPLKDIGEKGRGPQCQREGGAKAPGKVTARREGRELAVRLGGAFPKKN